MKKTLSVLFLMLIILIFYLPTIAQKETGNPFVTNYKVSEYKAHAQNWEIAQDERGFMYFGNGEGVLIYDANNWEVVPIDNKRSVRSLKIDNNGIVFVGSDTEFGYLYPTKTGKLKYFSLSRDYEHLNFRDIWEIHIINNTIYFQSRSHIFQYKNGEIRYWETNTEFDISFVFENELYAVEEEVGLVILKNDTFINAPLNEEFVNRNFYFCHAYKKKIYLANQESGLFEYDPIATTPEFKIIEGELSNTLRRAGVYTGTITDKGDLIIGTWTEGVVFGNTQGEITSKITIEQGILTNDILSTYIDKNKDLWLGLNNGISRCDISFPISTWNSFNGLEGSVTSILRHKNTLYVGTHFGLYYFDNKNIKKISTNTREVWKLMNYITPDTKDTLLVVATSRGVFRLHNNKLRQISSDNDVAYTIYQSKINPSILYFGSASNVGVIGFKNNEFIHLGNIENTGNSIRGILEDNENNLWVTTYRNGVVKVTQSYDPANPASTKLYELESGLPSLKNILVFNFKNRLVFGTEFGLYRFDYVNDKFVKETDINVDFFNGKHDIFSFIEDENGIVYAAQLNKRSGSIGMAIPNRDGSYSWNSSVFNRIPEMLVLSFNKEDNILWVGGTEGLFKCELENIKTVPKEIPVFIRKVQLSNDSVIFFGNFYSLNDTIFQIQETQSEIFSYEIDYKFRTIRFDFTCPDYTNKEHLYYQYYLKGHDKQWSPWVSHSSKEYSNLLEGSYTFLVRSNSSPNKITEFTFTIKPPYYRTIWAYIVYIIIAVLLFYLIIQISNKQLKQRNEALGILVQKRTHEIEQQNEEILAQSDSLEKQNQELEKLSLVARETDNAIVITDSKGTIEWVNEGFTRMYGYTFKELGENNYKNLSDFSISTNIQETIKFCLTNKQSKTYESLNRSRSGKNIWAQTTITPIFDEADNVSKLIVIESDISKLKIAEMEILQQKDEIKAQRDFANQQKQFIEQQNIELEKHRNRLEQLVKERTIELEAAKNKAEESDRLKSAFLANMSHEIRTPMNAIVGFTSLLKEPDLSTKNKQDLINHIVHNSDTLLHLIDDIIDIAKIEAGQLNINKRNCAINKILTELFETFNEKKKLLRKLDLEFILKPGINNDHFSVYTDPIRIQQILINLLDNAIKFTEKGSIEIGYNIEETVEDPSIVFYIKDSGIGLSKDQQSKIFTRFTKFENDRKKLYRGAGLGLAICKNLSNLLGGDIWVESEVNEGSTFYFNIPFIQKSEKEIRSKKQVEEVVNHNWSDKTILIAEDEESNFKFLEMALSKTNVKLEWALNGKEAIEKFQKNNIDLILMDIKMPHMDGLEATKMIRQMDNKIPIIVQTAFAMENDEKISIECGCNDYISKPINKDRLLRLISIFFDN